MIDDTTAYYDTDMSTVIYDSSWPQVIAKDTEEAFDIADWQFAYDEGDITAHDFIDVWGINPDDNYVIVIKIA